MLLLRFQQRFSYSGFSRACTSAYIDYCGIFTRAFNFTARFQSPRTMELMERQTLCGVAWPRLLMVWLYNVAYGAWHIRLEHSPRLTYVRARETMTTPIATIGASSVYRTNPPVAAAVRTRACARNFRRVVIVF